jgi:hypothetical protein
LGIVQQQIVERYVKRTSKPGDGGKSEKADEATEEVGDKKKKKLKGKARSEDDMDGRPLFGKGKA